MSWAQDKADRREAWAEDQAAAIQDGLDDYDRGADAYEPWGYADYAEREFGREP